MSTVSALGLGLKAMLVTKTKSVIKRNTNLSYLPLLCLTFSLSATQLSASEARSTNSTQNSESSSNSDELQPRLISYTPMPCVAADTRFSIVGTQFEQLEPAVTNIRLAIEFEGQREPIAYQIKSNSLLSALMPKQVENLSSVRIGLTPNKNWRSNSIEIRICAASEPDITTLTSRRRPGNSDRESHPGNSTDSSSERNQREVQTKPDPDIPDPDKPDTEADSDSESDPNSNLRRRIANRQTQGNLLGTGLPSLPPELRLKKTSDALSYVSNELVAVSADIDQAKQLAQIMSGFQARAIRRKTMGALDMVLTTFKLAPGSTVNNILEQLRVSHPEIWIDANHFYYPNADSVGDKQSNPKAKVATNRRTKLFSSINLASDSTSRHQCHSKVKIGILDGPVDQKVDSLASQSIVQKQLFSRGKKPASAKHATAIASLLVGSTKYPDLTGVISHAELAVGVVMQAQANDKKKTFTTTENLILGLNWLVEQQVGVINLSLGGPRNALLEIALTKVLALDIGVVAAAGNGGSNATRSYPAAQSGVIAVSALDYEGNLAEDATQGDYIALSAPGVDIWVASSNSDGRYLSGSSLAAPLVAAALAQLGGSPKHSSQLFKSSQDLGEPGKDSKFGWGLLQFPPCN
jgi:hypothetical protein